MFFESKFVFNVVAMVRCTEYSKFFCNNDSSKLSIEITYLRKLCRWVFKNTVVRSWVSTTFQYLHTSKKNGFSCLVCLESRTKSSRIQESRFFVDGEGQTEVSGFNRKIMVWATFEAPILAFCLRRIYKALLQTLASFRV